MDSRDLLIIAGVIALWWWWRRKGGAGACCAACAGHGAGPSSSGLGRPVSTPAPPVTMQPGSCVLSWCGR